MPVPREVSGSGFRVSGSWFLNSWFLVPGVSFKYPWRENQEPGARNKLRSVCYNPRMQRDDTDVVVKLKTDSRGVVNPAIVRWIAFTVITISLVACTVLCILAIWKFTESDAVWRAIATFIVVSIATAIFTFVNEKLG
jgi:Na+-transporting NADH:ubiquinone oxidoreductase subunit NqrB